MIISPVFSPVRFRGETRGIKTLRPFIGTIVGVPERIAASASYIDNWLSVLRNDKKLVVSAASRAQKAVEHILGPQGPQPVENGSEA